MGCDAHRAHFGRGEERVKWSSRPEWMACGQGGVIRKPRPGVASARSPEEDRSHMATPVIVAGGMESMSGAPYLLKKARFGVRMGHDELLDSMIADGLTCPITFVHMGITAENISAKYNISRQEQDEFAAESQQKTGAAIT